jgi:hypothetical protein
MKKNYTLIDGIALHKSFPATFDVPSADEIDRLEVGMFAKIGVEFNRTRITRDATATLRRTADPDRLTCGERFWVEITNINGNIFDGMIDNKLIYSTYHGLWMRDKIRFGRRHILETLHVTGIP